jgi:26S proteasome non-ATPase regulatory subunit 10
LLAKHGAKVNAKDATGATPLHRAASAGKTEAVRVLVEECSAKIDCKDKTGATPLYVAVSCDHASIALFLAGKGADLDAATKQGETPVAIARGDLAASLRCAAQQGMQVDE